MMLQPQDGEGTMISSSSSSKFILMKRWSPHQLLLCPHLHLLPPASNRPLNNNNNNYNSNGSGTWGCYLECDA